MSDSSSGNNGNIFALEKKKKPIFSFDQEWLEFFFLKNTPLDTSKPVRQIVRDVRQIVRLMNSFYIHLEKMSDHKGTHSFHVKNGNFLENSKIPGIHPT